MNYLATTLFGLLAVHCTVAVIAGLMFHQKNPNPSTRRGLKWFAAAALICTMLAIYSFPHQP